MALDAPDESYYRNACALKLISTCLLTFILNEIK